MKPILTSLLLGYCFFASVYEAQIASLAAADFFNIYSISNDLSLTSSTPKSISCEVKSSLYTVEKAESNIIDFTETHNIPCGISVTVNNLGYPMWNPPVIITPPNKGTASIEIVDGMYQLVYTSHDKGADTVVVSCAHATQNSCETGQYIFNSGCISFPIELPCDTTYVSDALMGGWATPPVLVSAPQHGTATFVDTYYLNYHPNTGFEGLDTIIVACAAPSPDDGCVSAIFLFDVSCSTTTGTIDESQSNELLWLPQEEQIKVVGLNCPKYPLQLANIQGTIVGYSAEGVLYTHSLPAGIYIATTPNCRGTLSKKIAIYH